MKFEEFEATWANHQPANLPAVSFVELKRTIIPELKRRSRFLGYEMFGVIFGLLIYPVLSVANYNYWGKHNVPWFWVTLPLHTAMSIASLVYVMRRLQRHRALLQQGTATLQAFAAVSVTSIEAEMQEYRVAFWLSPALLSLAFLSGYVGNPVGYGWTRFALQAGLMLGLAVPMGLVFWRHYRVNLKPAYARQQEILRQLSEEK